VKINPPIFTLIFLGFFVLRASATTYYVDANGTNPVLPYTDWSTAATNIQDAVDITSPGDLVLVTNGVYSSAGRVMSGATNCVVITNSIIVQSVNGPATTIIQAYPMPWVTNGSKRCMYLGSGAKISGFTLMNGAANGSSGGGIYCQSGFTYVSNCVLTCNSASSGGGGVSGSYDSCVISSNTAVNGGGGVYGSVVSALKNCLITSNSCQNGGGVYCAPGGYFVSNCVLSCNSAFYGGGGYDGSYYNCVITNNIATENGGGVYLIFNTPFSTLNDCLIADNFSISHGGGVYSYGAILNNCTIVGNGTYQEGGGVYNYSGGTFITNCIVYYNIAASQTNIAYTTNVFNCCTTPINGFGTNNILNSPGFMNIDGSDFRLAPWSPCIDAGTNATMTLNTDLGGNPRIVNNTVDIGAYEYQYQPFTNIVHYVALKNPNAAAPFTNWLTAATNIQSAIDASSPGDWILVSNGVYNTGGRAVYGLATNRVVVDVPVTVQSLSGAPLTIIQGSTSSPGMRCAYLTNGATMIGFTFAIGRANSGDFLTNECGGGVWCESPAATLINCSLTNNQSLSSGGGAYSGTLLSCVLGNNFANNVGPGGGAASSILINCVLTNNVSYRGGGAGYGVLSNCLLLGNISTFGAGSCSNSLYSCILVSNRSSIVGGGAYSCILSNCTLTGNMAINSGGGATYGQLFNCTLAGNTALNGGGAASNTLLNCLLSYNFATNNGGGIFYATPTNCTFLGNSSKVNGGGAFGGTFNNCFFNSNSAAPSGGFGGGACFGTASNCIFTNNSAMYGGGMASNIANNCLMISNSATDGGGVDGGTLNNCSIIDNTVSSSGGGSALANLNFCNLFNNRLTGVTGGGGGGAYGGTITSCILSNNFSSTTGGGAASATLTDCLIIKNSAGIRNAGQGGGAYQCNLNNCTIVFNPGLTAVSPGTATNCIIYYNGGNWSSGSSLSYCCTYPYPAGPNSPGCITNEPLFVDTNGDFHLQSNSPCINSGNHVFVSIATDFDGNPRIVGGNVDPGAYEYQNPGSVISYAYLQQYGLPTDGSVDYASLNGAPYTVYQDWVAGLNPTNPASTFILSLMPAAPTNFIKGLTVSWQGTTNIYYNLQRSTNLSAQPAFSTIQPNIIGNNGITSFTDKSATNSNPYFYRVDVVGP
jgi:hypothetical protein